MEIGRSEYWALEKRPEGESGRNRHVGIGFFETFKIYAKVKWRLEIKEENSVEVVGVEQGRFPDSYYYDYEIQLEQKQKILNNLKMKEEERRKSTLSYKFSSMDKQDQWALIGAALCLVVILLVVSYMLYLRRKRLADDISVENRHSLDKRLRSTEKPALWKFSKNHESVPSSKRELKNKKPRRRKSKSKKLSMKNLLTKWKKIWT